MSLRHSAAYVAVRLASGALAMASLALIVRGLGPAGYGALSLGLAAAAAVTQILFNPLNGALARFYGEPARRAAMVAVLRACLVVIGVVLVCAAWLAEALGWRPISEHVLLAAACMALAQGMFDFSGQHLAAAQQSLRYSAQFLGKALLTLLLAWCALRAGGGPAWVLAAMAASFMLSALLSGGWRGNRAEAQPTQEDVVVLARFAGPLLLTSAFNYGLLWGDRYLLQQMVPLAELGRYSAVMDLAQQTLGLIFSGLCTAWYARLVLAWGRQDEAEAQRLYVRYAALGLAVMLPAGVGFACLLAELLPLLYGAAYGNLPAALLPLITATAMVAALKAYYLDLPLLLARRVWRHGASIAGAAVLSLLLAWWLVPVMGSAGAALGLLLGQSLGVGVSAWAGRGVLAHRLPWALAWPPVLSVALMAGVLWGWPLAASWAALLGKAAAGAAVYAGLMFVADFDGVRGRLLGEKSRPQKPAGAARRIVLFANTDWFLYNFKRSLAEALRARGDEVLLLSPPGEYGPRLRALGFRWEPLPVSRSGLNPLAELAVIVRLARLYRDWQPDLVHHFTIKCVIYGSFAARWAGVRGVVNSITGLGFVLLAQTRKARVLRPLVLALYRVSLHGTQVIFQNPDNRATLAGYGVLRHCGVQVIAGDGIDTASFAPAQPDSRAEPLQVLMMARLLYSKGVADFVAAAAQVRQQMPGARFLLAGEPDAGNPETVSASDLAAWQAQGAVEFLGQRSDVLALNHAASVVVLASRQGEGIPRALLEGAACGVPMVATDVPGCRELVLEGQTGLLVPPSAPDLLAAALLRLLGDAPLRTRLGAAARAYVLAHFADEVVIEETCAAYEQAGSTA